MCIRDRSEWGWHSFPNTENYRLEETYQYFDVESRKVPYACLLYTSDAADERSSVDLGGRRIIKKKKKHDSAGGCEVKH